MATSGVLKVTVIEARLDRDIDYWGTMDPYVRFQHRMEYKRTKSHTDGGKNPKWGETIEFDIKYIGDDMMI